MYYPEQQIDPLDMKKEHENILNSVDKLLSKIQKLRDKAETFFEELTISQLEDILSDAEYYLDELSNLSTEDFELYDEYSEAKYMVDDIEEWLREKQEAIQFEDK